MRRVEETAPNQRRRPLRIGFITCEAISGVTGGCLYNRLLVKYLLEQGDRVYEFSLPRRSYARQLIRGAPRALGPQIEAAGCDVLIEDELAHPVLPRLNKRLKERHSFPIVTLVHMMQNCKEPDNWPPGASAASEHCYLATIDGAIYNSLSSQAAAQSLLRGRQIPSVVAYPAADHLDCGVSRSRAVQRALEGGALRILCVANVLPGKGAHTLIDAMSKMTAADSELTIVGSVEMDRRYAAALRGQIIRLGLKDRVVLTGEVDNARIPQYLANHQVMAVPSKYEALGICYLEAMKFGLPAVASAAGGASEIIDHGREGFLVEPEDSMSLALFLDALARDRGKLAEMSVAAYDRAQTHPTWQKTFELIREFLTTLVG
jgi:glycosyltransferase involved in cell wall biosynthesis